MGGNLWVLIAAPVAVLAAWLFLSVYGEQKADGHVTKTEQRRDRAEFDRDFSQAWNGKASPVLEKRASDAADELTRAEEERKRVEAERKAIQAEQEKQLRELLMKQSAGAKP